MSTMKEIRQLVRIINMRFVNGCTSETLDTIESQKTDPYIIAGYLFFVVSTFTETERKREKFGQVLVLSSERQRAGNCTTSFPRS